MSKASELVEQLKALETQRQAAWKAIPQFDTLGKFGGDVHAHVREDGSLCIINCQRLELQLTAEKALLLGRWLIDTFGESSEAKER